MALDHLLTTLEREGEERSGEIVAKARADVARLEAEAAVRREETRRRQLAEATAKAAARVETAVVEGRRRGLASVLAARASFLDRVFGAAQNTFSAAIDRPAYRKALPDGLSRALRYLGNREASIHVSPNLVEPVVGWVGGQPHRVIADPSVGDGFQVKSLDGGVVVDDTLAARLRRQGPDLAIAIIERGTELE